MARVFIDGFESGGIDLWDGGISGSLTIATGVTGADGTYCLQANWPGGSYVRKTLPGADEYYFAMMMRYGNDFPRPLVQFMNGSTFLGGVYRNSGTGFLEVFKGCRGTLIVAGTHIQPVDTFFLMEVRYKPSTTTGGIFVVKINGITDIDFSGGATALNALQINQFELGDSGGGGSYYGRYYDNIVVDDAEFPGKTFIRGIVPTGAGNLTQWTPSAGSNYTCVDEKPASDSDAVTVNAVDQVDLYAAGDLTDSVEAVKCVQVQARCVKEGLPTPQNLQLAVRTNSTDYFSGSKVVPTSAKSLFNVWATNPNTSAAWTKTEVNAMEIGMKAVA